MTKSLRTRVSRSLILWALPPLVLALLTTMSILAWQKEHSLIAALAKSECQHRLEEAALRLQTMLRERHNDIALLARQWCEYPSATRSKHFLAEATSLVQHEPSYHVINFVDTESVIRISAPADRRPELIGKDLKTLPGRAVLHDEVRRVRTARLSPPMRLTTGRRGAVLWVPVIDRRDKGGDIKGMVAGAFHVDALIERTIPSSLTEEFCIEVQLAGVPVFQRRQASGMEARSDVDVKRQRRFEVLGRTFQVTMEPCVPSRFGRLVRDSQYRLWLHLGISCLAAGLLAGVVGLVLRVRASRDRLRESEERFRNIVRASPMGMHLYELDDGDRLILIDANPTADRHTGIETQTLLGKTIEEAFPSLAGTEVIEHYKRAARDGIPWQTATLQYEDEQIRGAYDVYAFQTSPRRMAAMFMEVTNRVRAEQALRESEENLRITLNSIGDAVIATDRDGCIVRMNPVAETTTGWGLVEAAGLSLMDVFRVADFEAGKPRSGIVQQIMAQDEPLELGSRLLLRTRKGDERIIASSGAPIRDAQNAVVGVVLVFRDVTEQVRIEAQLRQSQKMDSIGQLAGGVAHDFSNMLGGILGYAELLALRTAENPNLRRFCEQIITVAERAADLTAKLLTFSRKGETVVRPLDVHTTIQEAVELLAHSIDRRIRIESQLTAEKSVVRGDSAHLQNVILNLGVNARDAMPDGGTLCIQTNNEIVDAERAAALGVAPGVFLRIRVEDTGIGMSPDVVSRVFEPFYTTKEVGKGTGLGLSAAYGTIRDHYGAIQVESALGKGTAFDLYLPVTEEAVVAESADSEGEDRAVGTILFVDDEEVLRDATCEMLSDMGYDVIEAADGEAGVRAYEKHHERVDLVILDMVMPKMNGQHVFRAIRQINPEVRVLISSGHAQDAAVAALQEEGRCGFLKKPYHRADLRQAIRTILGDSA